MGIWCSYFLFLLWLSYLFVCGILLFTRGFLLSRQTLPHNSTCELKHYCRKYRELSEQETNTKNMDYLECLDQEQLRLLPANSFKYACKNSKRRIVLLLIDALKYDFVVYNSSIPKSEWLPYQNRMPIIQELLGTLPGNTRLFKFIANPPTTTMQRLKGLMTGSLPTFIDAGLNFGAPEISEDNILNQVVNEGKKIVTMGDDVWTNLFPRRSVRAYPYSSFNMLDLDTVDSAVVKHLKTEIYEKDWSLLIAHVLGVDHCGHAHGPNHHEMTRKLTQMNSIIRDLVDSIDDDTILLVIGDHGMTVTGDHGGESEDEVTSALFVYSPMPLLPPEITDRMSTIYQVDLVPTVAFLLGTAIPFSSLGKIVLELLPLPEIDNGSLDSHVPYATEALVANIEQIMLYINTYSRHSHLFSKDKISSIAHKFHNLRDDLEHVRDLKSFKTFRTKSLKFLNFVRELFEEIWVQFDSFLMSRGLVLTFLLLSFTFIIMEGLPAENLVQVLDGGFLYWAFALVCICVSGSFFLQHMRVVEDGFLLMCVSSLTLAVFLMAVTVVQHWKCISALGFYMYRTRAWMELLPRTLLLCSLLLFFSNSFVVEEAQVLLFLVNTSVIIIAASMTPIDLNNSGKLKREERSWLRRMLSQPKMRAFGLLLLFACLLRCTAYYWRCREEQSWCVEVPRKVIRGGLDILATLAVLALFTSAVRMWLRGCGNLVGFSPAVTLARYAPSVIVVCTGGYWVLQGLPRDTRVRLLVPWQQQLLPWTVYILLALGMFALVLQPLCVYVVEKKTDCLYVYGRANIIPQLFHQVKEVMMTSEKPRVVEDSPVVYGLATVYSAMFVILGQYLCLLFVLLLGEQLAPSAVLLFACVVSLLFFLSYVRLESTLVAAQLFHVPWSYVISWGLLSSYLFYGTGHQPTIPSIQWHAAFVGTGGQFTNHIVPAFLIGVNTFCSHALLGVLLPLLLVAPFTLFIMLPRWLPLSQDKDGRDWKRALWEELKQGELLLYEKEGILQYAAFKLAAKYLLYHAVRVTASMLAAAFHCRHLMVWAVFAPRFIFEGLGFFVTLTAVLLSYLLLARTSSKISLVLTDLLRKNR